MSEKNNQDRRRKLHHELNNNPLMKSMNDFFNQKPVKRLLSSIDEFFEQPFPITPIPMEMVETEKEIIITANLPGVKREQINIEYSSNQLTVSVNHAEQIEENNEKASYYYKTNTSNHLSRSIILPYPINEKAVRASYRDGQLKIQVPKQKRRKITINDD